MAENVERQRIAPKLDKITKEYNKLNKWVENSLNFERLRSDVFHDLRDEIVARNVWIPAVKKEKRKRNSRREN